jgi:hypothetical protein
VTVNFACRVTDPTVIARDNVRDMTAALSPSLSSIVRGTAARFDVLNTASAENAVTIGLNAAYPAPAVQLSNFAVTVTAVNAAEIVTAVREARVAEIRRDAMRPVAGGGRTELLAHMMAINGGDPTSLLDREQDARESDARAKLDALRLLVGAGEEHSVARIGEQAMSTFFGPEGAPITPKGGIRDRIERKNRAALEGGRSVVEENPDGAAPDTAGGPPADEPRGDGRRVSRVRGTAGGGSRTADDR